MSTLRAKYYVYKLDDEDPCKKLYCTGIPGDDNLLGGIGYQSKPDNSPPDAAATAPNETEALKVAEYLRTAFYGAEEPHFIEAVR